MMTMRTRMVAVLLGMLLCASACVPQRKVALTDTEMDRIGAGWDLCGQFGIRGPCVGSFMEVYDPALGSPQTPYTSTIASPLPESGTVTLNQSVTIQGLSSFQSVSQTNSLTVTPPPPYLCTSCSRALDRLWLPSR